MSHAAPMKEPLRTTEQCRYCWMCRHACPVGRATSREAHTPHAWALTVESVRRGQLAWDADSVDLMYACADCGLCQTHCVTNQPLPDAVVEVRAGLVAAGLAPAAVGEVASRLQRYGNAFETQPPKRLGARGAVALFAGDAASSRQPASIDAVLRLLATAGVGDVVVVGQGRSSGLLASSLGLVDLARSLAREMVDELQESGATQLVVLSAADRWTFDYVYPTRLGVTLPQGLHPVEVATVLARAHADGRLSFRRVGDDLPYAYHDPCHSPRGRRDPESARTLLAAVLGAGNARELFWRERRAHPCGAIGGLEYTHPDISDALAEARIRDVHACGARRLVVDDASCFAHLSRHAGSGIDVVGLYDVLQQGL